MGIKLLRRFLFPILILYLLLTGTAFASFSVVTGHPRIYLRPADIIALRARVQTPAISPFYQQLKSEMDGTSTPHSNLEVAGWQLQSLVLLHLVEGGTAYRDKILSKWILYSWPQGGSDAWIWQPIEVMGHALALDWMWNDLTPTQRQQIGNIIVALMDDLRLHYPHDLGPNPSWANQGCDYSNKLYYPQSALPFAGLALAGEGINDTRAAFYLSEADNLIHNYMIKAVNQEAGGDAELNITSGFSGNGGWGEDMDHISYTHPMFAQMVEAWRTGTGEDLFPKTNGLAKIAQYITYLRRPGGYLSPKGNRTYTYGIPDNSFGHMGTLLSARYQDPFAKYLKDVSKSGKTYGFHQVGSVLWYNGSLSPLDFASIPKRLYFKGQGEVVARSGFGSNDTWTYLRSGIIYNGHQHDDQGNFLIEAYGGELFVENAGLEDNDALIGTSNNHNTFSIGGEQIRYGDNAVQYVQPMEGTQYEYGRITDYQEGTEYTYAASDFSKAYPDAQVPAPKAGKVTREMVTIMPDIVVLRDRVSGNGTIEFLIHTWSGKATLDNAAQTIVSRHGTGHGWMKTVLPAQATLSKSTQGGTDLIKIRANSPSTPETFLTVFYLSPDAVKFIPSDLVYINESGSIGVSLTDRTGNNWQVRFNKTGTGLVSVIKNGGIIPEACGNGVIDPGEDCEQGLALPKTCADLPEFDGGSLGCNSDCTFNTSQCYKNVQACGDGLDNDSDGKTDLADQGCSSSDDNDERFCGDGFLDTNEQCDGSNLNGKTCSSMGWGAGVLSCESDCKQFDGSGCSTCTPFVCDDTGAECGSPGNGCGGTLNCGSCSEDLTCSDDYRCVSWSIDPSDSGSVSVSGGCSISSGSKSLILIFALALFIVIAHWYSCRSRKGRTL